MTPIVTVLVPTHNHPQLLPLALRSALAQRLSDIEVFVVGDGAGPATRDAVESIARGDARVRYFEFDKGERHGERHRHAALAEARGRIVAYLSDDDLWLPDHLDNLVAGLADADFAHTLHTELLPEGRFRVLATDLARPPFATAMLTGKVNYFGPTVVGHTLAIYRALPDGWRPAPPDVWSDLHMWRQFLGVPGIRLRTLTVSDTLHLASSKRRDVNAEGREIELAAVSERLLGRDGADWYRRSVSEALCSALVDAAAAEIERKPPPPTDALTGQRLTRVERIAEDLNTRLAALGASFDAGRRETAEAMAQLREATTADLRRQVQGNERLLAYVEKKLARLRERMRRGKRHRREES